MTRQPQPAATSCLANPLAARADARRTNAPAEGGRVRRWPRCPRRRGSGPGGAWRRRRWRRPLATAASGGRRPRRSPCAPTSTRWRPCRRPCRPTPGPGDRRRSRLPDNLTRYRVMVVAVAGGKQFGKGESAITARLPLMVRPSAPRFLNFGDRFELPVVRPEPDRRADDGRRRAAEPPTCELDRRAQGRRVDRAGQRPRRGALPGHDVRVGHRPLPGGRGVGQAGRRGRVSALPVYTPATTEAFAIYGVRATQGAIAQPVIAPTDVYTQFGGLEISTSSTALQALTDAVLYLVHTRSSAPSSSPRASWRSPPCATC